MQSRANDPTNCSAPKKPLGLRYLWPTPTSLLLWLAGMGIARFLGQRAFFAVHALFEIGILIALFASVIYSIRLSGKGSPRWILILNLASGPLIFGILLVCGVVSLLQPS